MSDAGKRHQRELPNTLVIAVVVSAVLFAVARWLA